MKKPKIPGESQQVRQLRERQIRELAEVDEDENERLKAAFILRRGVRAFRRSGASDSSTSSSSGSDRGNGSGRMGGGRIYGRRAER